ncbi:MAG: 4'-phosphopantetheinyl transferase family protein [Acidimicrobiales bacterium]
MRWADVELAVAREPADLDELAPGERDRLPVGLRQHDWLLGRAALKALLGPGDTSTVAFPNRTLSLTHSAGVAVAARCDGPQAGLGVDLEGWRGIDPRAARFYLAPDEQGDLLRLWTVKEALFKATPDNHGPVFVDYRVDDAEAMGGCARDRHGRTFEYLSRRRPEGWLTIAVCDAAA